jgi:excisionase family DNA binding protein
MVETQKTHSFTVNKPAATNSLKECGLPGARPDSENNSHVLITVQEVSRILNIHENTVRRWSNQGVLKPIRLGPRGDRRYKLKDITDYLVSVRSGTVSPNK